MLTRLVRALLVLVMAFLAFTAIAGGLGLLTGVIAPPTELLRGSPFADYTVPGLALLLPVGCFALAATVLLWRRHRLGLPASLLAGVMILCFEGVEVAVIGSEPGVARTLQGLYVVVGGLIVLLAALLWLLGRRVGVAAGRTAAAGSTPGEAKNG